MIEETHIDRFDETGSDLVCRDSVVRVAAGMVLSHGTVMPDCKPRIKRNENGQTHSFSINLTAVIRSRLAGSEQSGATWNILIFQRFRILSTDCSRR